MSTQDHKIREELLAKLLSQDPGLPRSNPTQSHWQRAPHALAASLSASLPLTTDIAVVGSGITGVSVTKTVLEQHPTHGVTVFEARTLCSGATGRNGGQLAINAAENYVVMKEELGSEMAGKIIQFNIKTLERLHEIGREMGADDTELTLVTKVRAFKDMETWDKVKAGVKALEEDHPSLRGIYQLVDTETCEKEHGVFGAIGGLLHSAGTIWPYRLVTKVFEVLKSRYEFRLAIETHTPVTAVDFQPATNERYPYILTTPRGVVRSSKVVYCTNGYTSHLLPNLRGVLYPMKGTMTVQDIKCGSLKEDSPASWAIHYTPFEDFEDGTIADGLIYGMKNQETGAFWFGGEKATLAELLSADDDVISSSCETFLRKSLLSLFLKDPNNLEQSKLISTWSGVMCFSSDGMPLIGRLPETITTRAGTEEWICAAYNGYGMPIAWLAGESLGQMVHGKPPQDGLPEAYLLTPRRLQEKLTPEASLQRLMSH